MKHVQRPLGLGLVLILVSLGGDEPPREDPGAARPDVVTYRLPDDDASKGRLIRGADWLKRNIVLVTRPDDTSEVRVIAWKDPTLEPENPKLLAGYVITDTLWSARALEPFDPSASRDLRGGVERLGWRGNGLHEVLFHPVDTILHRSADVDAVHGFSLGRFPTTGGRTVDLRVFRQKFDARFDVGHPRLFTEHAIYHALHDYWQGREAQARRRIRDVVADRRAEDPGDRTFWDGERHILVDFVNYEPWLAFHGGERPACRHYTFKLGVLLYAIRLLGMESEMGDSLDGMKRRLWNAQTESGGLAHFVDVGREAEFITGRQPTGEATAIAILSEVVEARRPRVPRSLPTR